MQRRTFLLGALGALGAAQTQRGEDSLGLLAYVQRSGLWVKELPNGTPQRLASGRTVTAPRFSPSGEWLAYMTGSDEHLSVCLISRDGTREKRWVASGYTWLPQRDEIAIAAHAEAEIFAAEDGWKAPKFTIPNASLPVFSRNGLHCAFTRELFGGKYPDGSAKEQVGLYVQELRTGASARLLEKHDGMTRLYGFSQDNQAVLYWHYDEVSASFRADGLEVFSIDVSGGKQKSLGFRH